MYSYSIISFSIMLAVLISEVLPFVFRIKMIFKLKRLKPFDCAMCMSGWLAFIISLLEGLSLMPCVYNMVISMFIVVAFTWINQQINGIKI